MIFSIEGPEMTGKTTFHTILKEGKSLLEDFYQKEFFFQTEPSKDINQLAPSIRKLCVDTEEIGSMTHLLLYLTARINLLEEIVSQGLFESRRDVSRNKDKILVLDRYTKTTTVLQKAAGVPMEIIKEIHELLDIPKPALEVVLTFRDAIAMRAMLDKVKDEAGRRWERWLLEKPGRIEEHLYDYSKTTVIGSDCGSTPIVCHILSNDGRHYRDKREILRYILMQIYSLIEHQALAYNKPLPRRNLADTNLLAIKLCSGH